MAQCSGVAMQDEGRYRQTDSALPLAEVVERLAAAVPKDKPAIDLTKYRALRPPWTDWGSLVE